MKYTIEIEIDKPIDEVSEKFQDPESLKHWQKGFDRIEELEGEPGKNGSTSILHYKNSGLSKLKETIIDNQLPKHFHASYQVPGMWNGQKNFFEKIDDHKTRWISESEFKADKFMYKIMLKLMPGAFKKQSREFMVDFKNYVEHGTSVN